MSKNNENKLLPSLRFSEFRNDRVWKVKPLGEVLIKNSTKNKDQKYSLVESVSNKFGFIKQDEYFDNRIIASKDTSNYYVINRGHFAYNPSRIDVGSLAYKSDDNTSIISPLYVSFKANNSLIDDIFLLNYFKSNEFTKQMIFEGGVRNTLNYDNLSQIKVPITQLDEQRKIAACLSSLDEIIKAESEKLNLLHKYKKGLLQNLFPKEGETVPEFRFKEFTKSWKKVKLKDVSLYFNGGSFENDVKEEGRYELITLRSINSYGQLVSSNRFIDIEVPTLAKDTLVMILSEQAPGLLGMTAIIPTANKFVLNQRVAEIRPSQEVDSYFLSMAINRNQAYFSKQGAGMKVQNISKPNVQNYEFLIPEIQEQRKIATCLSSLDEIISAQNQTLDSLQYHKKGLLQGLFPIINNEE